MRRSLVVAAIFAVILFFAGCSKSVCPVSGAGASGGVSTGGAAAVVGGVDITMAELDAAAKSQLQKVDTEIYQIKKRALDNLVEEKLLEERAKKKGLSVEKYLAEEIDSKIVNPTDDDIKKLYEANKDRMGKPFDEVKGQIEGYLKEGNRARLKGDLLAKLRGETEVIINIDPPRAQINTEGMPSTGDENAKITLVEFSDYQCPFCKRVRPTIWRLMDEYKGKIRYFFADYPLPFHKDAKKASEAAHCAGDQGKYFEYNRKIFDNQSKISTTDLKTYAKELQLKTKDFDKCLDSGKHSKDVDELADRGAGAGVTGTPAYFINGIMLSGAMPYESFKEVVDSELNR